MKTALFCLCTLALLPLANAQEAVREWTNSEGKSITASLLELSDETAKLRLENGQKYDVPLASLSEADQAYAAEWLAAQAAGEKAEGMGLVYGVLTDPIIETAFDEETAPTRKADLVEGWKAGIGEWRIEDSVLIGDEVAEDNHASSLTTRFEATHLIINAEVQLGTAESIAFACRDTVDKNLHLGRLYITPDKLWIQHMTGIAKTTRSEKLVTEEVEIDPEAWYAVTIEIIGDRYRAVVGDHEIEAQHPRFADAKGIIALVNKGQGARFRNVSLWHAEPTAEAAE